MPAIPDNNQANRLFLWCLSRWVEMPALPKITDERVLQFDWLKLIL